MTIFGKHIKMLRNIQPVIQSVNFKFFKQKKMATIFSFYDNAINISHEVLTRSTSFQVHDV